MYMLLLIHRDMFKLLGIRRAKLNKSTLTSFQGGERSCACLASYKCEEGVHPVRETISCKSISNPLCDSIAHLGGGVKQACGMA